MSLDVRLIDRETHLAFVTERSASFLQCPSWAGVKAEWGHLNLGWYDGPTLVGAGLVLLRRTPGLQRYLAYLPEGPVLDWQAYDPKDVLSPLVCTLKRQKAFAVKIGPQLPVRRWAAATLKDAIADGEAKRLRDVPPDSTDKDAVALTEALTELGWRQVGGSGAGFADVQPRYVFQLPLAGRTDEELLTGFNQLWRRNIKKADKAGVEVVLGGADDLAGVPRALRHDRQARRLHPARADVLPADVEGHERRGPRPDPALPRPPRRRGPRGDHGRPGRPARLVLLRRQLRPPSRGPPEQRHPVADDARRPRRRRERLRPPRASATPSTRTTTSSG